MGKLPLLNSILKFSTWFINNKILFFQLYFSFIKIKCFFSHEFLGNSLAQGKILYPLAVPTRKLFSFAFLLYFFSVSMSSIFFDRQLFFMFYCNGQSFTIILTSKNDGRHLCLLILIGMSPTFTINMIYIKIDTYKYLCI